MKQHFKEVTLTNSLRALNLIFKDLPELCALPQIWLLCLISDVDLSRMKLIKFNLNDFDLTFDARFNIPSG